MIWVGGDIPTWIEASALAPMGAAYLQQYLARRAIIRSNVEFFNPQNSEIPYGLDDFVDEIEDLIDLIANPQNYNGLTSDNEILMVGPPQSGKDTAIIYAAKLAGIEVGYRVSNTSDDDVLAYVRRLLARRHWRDTARIKAGGEPEKVLILLNAVDDPPRPMLGPLIDEIVRHPHIMLAATTNDYDRLGPLASNFGTILQMPRDGIDKDPKAPKPPKQQLLAVDYLRANCEGEWKKKAGTNYIRMNFGDKGELFTQTILEQAINPSEIKDIIRHCLIRARHELLYLPPDPRDKGPKRPIVTPEILRASIRRVIPPGFEPLEGVA